MDAELVVLIATIAAAVVTGLFTLVARRMTPKVERNSTIVRDALEMVAAYRTENQELRHQIEELRHRDDE